MSNNGNLSEILIVKETSIPENVKIIKMEIKLFNDFDFSGMFFLISKNFTQAAIIFDY